MIEFVNFLVVDDSQVKDGPADHGRVIGYIYKMGNVVVEAANLPTVPDEFKRLWFHDGWIRISKPATWKQTGKAGWIELAALRPVAPAGASERKQYLLTVGGDEPPTIVPL